MVAERRLAREPAAGLRVKGPLPFSHIRLPAQDVPRTHLSTGVTGEVWEGVPRAACGEGPRTIGLLHRPLLLGKGELRAELNGKPDAAPG
ncbi:hypothetical protein GCM10007147_11610 [Nocardiopsis kunsanensis]|uniref:Uncharacterized protein n=1 Tax=Nocardiopsis kunsanensis TaxID=141693 RepID=A0A918XAM7_9ACTN|nr:hypothetical protein GCM10007147_11610 [Nocardiopsis kunsanensis]